MRNSTLSLYGSLIASLIVSQTAFAAAFQLYELGTPIVGTAAVGQAAVAEDASTTYFNPAGMALLPTTEAMLGSQLLLPYTNFSKNTATTILGDNGGNAATLTPGMNLYYVYRYSPCLDFGISVTSPYGGSLIYSDGWVGRFVVQSATFYTININPSIAYRVNEWFSAGAGVALEYMNLQETVALPITTLVDGQAKISVADYSPGFNLGVMLTPYPTTKIGAAYRSQIIHSLHGNTTFLRISTTPDTSTKMVMPQNIILSLAQDISQFTLLGELGWSNWSSMQNTILNVQNYTVIVPQNWHDTYRAGVGGIYRFTPDFKLQAGFSYDSSPTSSSRRLPDLPMDRQIRIGAGIMYALIKPATLGVSYEYWNLGHASINNTSANGVLAGSYTRNYANTLQVSMNVDV